ncbi:MAG: hypothetical protein U1E73_02975 [Planctomycetota bacterium]
MNATTSPTFDRFVAHLQQVTPTSRGVRALCPAHADHNPSLDVDLGDDGCVLLACRSARCTTDAILEALGLKKSDLFPPTNSGGVPKPRARKKEKTKHPTADAATKAMCWLHSKSDGQMSRQHDYQDSAGAHVMRTMRFDFPNGAKQFGQAHLTVEGFWVNGGMPPLRPLFRLPELLAASVEQPVLVTEGEKCAEACVALGFVATTSSQGAEAAKKTDWSALRERHVVILPDNDESGRKYRDAVIRLAQDTDARSVSVLELDGLGEGDDVADWIQSRASEGLDEPTIRAQLRDLVAKAPCAARPHADRCETDLPQIAINPGRLREVVDKAEAALIANRGAGHIYQRGSQVVRVARVDEPSSPRHGTSLPAQSPIIMGVGATYLRSLLETSAQFVRVSDDKVRVVSCPPDVASCYLQSAGHWRIPVLRSLVSAPTLRVDGSVLQTAGYDSASCLLYDPCGVAFKPVPVQPTLTDARAAAARILALVQHFDFVDDGSRSVWLAGLLTALVRPILPTAPMFVIDAPTRGSGKSKLASVVGIVATGRPPATMTLVDDVDETRKRVLALLLQGASVVNIDNVDVPIGGAALCTVLTEQTYSDRILGASEIVRVPTISTWITTGNNVVISGDMTRRVLVARLDPRCERPEDRRFDFDPVVLAEQRRPDLVVDALTILRAHAVAGRPQAGISPFGSFETWSEVIRAAIVWVGLSDPIAGRQAIAEADGGAFALAELLRQWHSAFGDRELTTRQVITSAGPELLDAIDEVIGSDVVPGNRCRRLGQVLAQWRDRIVGGHQAVRGRDAHAGTSRWAVLAPGDGGNGGNGGNPGATRATFPVGEDPHDEKQGRTSAKVPTVPTVPTIGEEEAPAAQPRILPLNDVVWQVTAGPDDGMPEQPGRHSAKRPRGGS